MYMQIIPSLYSRVSVNANSKCTVDKSCEKYQHQDAQEYLLWFLRNFKAKETGLKKCGSLLTIVKFIEYVEIRHFLCLMSISNSDITRKT